MRHALSMVLNGQTGVVRLSDGRDIAFCQWGAAAGFPVIACHGTPGSRVDRFPDLNEYVAAGVRLITYDRPGYGLSTRKRGRRVGDCVGDVEAILDTLRIEQCAVSGASGGAPHALAVAAGLGDRVVRVQAMVCPAPIDQYDGDWFAGMDPLNIREFGLATGDEYALHDDLRAQLDDWIAKEKQTPGDFLPSEWDMAAEDREVLADPQGREVVTQFLRELDGYGVWGWADDDRAMLQPWGFDLTAINVPVRIEFGLKDVLVPAAHGEWLASHVPGAVRVARENSGHLLPASEFRAKMAWLTTGE